MRIERLLRALCAEPWALEPQTLAIGADILRRKLSGAIFSGEDLHTELGIATPRERQQAREANIAVIPVLGIIEQRAHSLGSSVEGIEAAFDSALVSKQFDGILLDIDSPGGSVPGVPELAEKIRDARDTKPVVAIANSLAASAAYWIGSSAEEFFVSPSGEAGSIGVFMLHVDESEALEKEGVKVTAISAGKFKTEGAPWEALSEETAEFFQERVDEVFAWFTKAVAASRDTTPAAVRSGFGEGRVLGAVQSVKANLADKVGTFNDAVSRVAQLSNKRPRGKRASTLRNEMALDNADGII